MLPERQLYTVCQESFRSIQHICIAGYEINTTASQIKLRGLYVALCSGVKYSPILQYDCSSCHLGGWETRNRVGATLTAPSQTAPYSR